MAFDDLPIIDKYSRNADTSEIKLRELFNQHSNFICRIDVPDKGCDFDVEMIAEGASNWRFPVQLKSIENLNRVSNAEFISYSFETSRLGYLLRRPISGGLIVLYSVKEDKCYYEYADKIYERLSDERENENWKKIDKVNIRIPSVNVLNHESAKEVHKVFLRRFEQGAKMQRSHGAKYGLPIISENKFDYDFNNTEHLKKFFQEQGYLLLSNHDFDILYPGIIRLPSIEIISDKNLLIIAIVVYSEAAQYMESEMFISKFRKMYKTNEDEDLIVEFQQLKNKLMLGYIDNAEFIEKLEKIKVTNSNSANSITTQINILRYKVIEHNELKNFDKLPSSFEIECQHIFDLIKNCDCSKKIKNLFKIWNGEILSMIIIDRIRSSLTLFQLREALGATISIEEKKTQILLFVSSQTGLITQLNEIYKWAISKDDLIIKGNVLSAYVTHFLQKEIMFIGFGQHYIVQADTNHDEELKLNYGFAIEAYNCFGKLNMLKESYYNLCNAIEILLEGELLFNSEVKSDKTYLLSIKGELEMNSDVKPYDFQIPKLLIK